MQEICIEAAESTMQGIPYTIEPTIIDRLPDIPIITPDLDYSFLLNNDLEQTYLSSLKNDVDTNSDT
jgi:hypothetical protein